MCKKLQIQLKNAINSGVHNRFFEKKSCKYDMVFNVFFSQKPKNHTH